MATHQAKVTSKGQVTLPKKVRSSLLIKTGDRLEFALDAPGSISVRKLRRPGSSTGCGKSFLRGEKRRIGVEDMDTGLREAIKNKFVHLKSSEQMIAFDTNYLVRHIVQDDAKQCRTVASLLTRESDADRQVRIFDLVLMETFWVLQSVYEFDRKACVHVLEELLEDAAFSFDDRDRLRLVLRDYRKGKADLADYLIIHTARLEGAELKSFDKKVQKHLRDSRLERI